MEVALAGDGERARLDVRDHGIGIPAESQGRIFERFERLAPVQSYGGFGLGLWIVRLIVEAHGGTVSVKSRSGEGSVFTVELPLRPTEGDLAHPPPPHATARRSARGLAPRREASRRSASKACRRRQCGMRSARLSLETPAPR